MRVRPEHANAALAGGGAAVSEKVVQVSNFLDSELSSSMQACQSGESLGPGRAPSPIPSAAVDTLAARQRSIPEGDDIYPCVVQISATSRVVECAAGLQWIMQRRRGARWHAVSFHRDRDVLIERCGRMSSDALRALPPYHLGDSDRE